MGAGLEETEEDGWWESKERTTANGRCIGKGDYDYNKYAPPHPKSEAVAASSNSDLVIPFAFGYEEAVATAVGYTKLVFTVFSWAYILILVH